MPYIEDVGTTDMETKMIQFITEPQDLEVGMKAITRCGVAVELSKVDKENRLFPSQPFTWKMPDGFTFNTTVNGMHTYNERWGANIDSDLDIIAWQKKRLGDFKCVSHFGK